MLAQTLLVTLVCPRAVADKTEVLGDKVLSQSECPGRVPRHQVYRYRVYGESLVTCVFRSSKNGQSRGLAVVHTGLGVGDSTVVPS